MEKTKLSIICLTYNHEKFIRQALDGFVMQKTNFDFEVIIHDDASTDGTADIIREYEKKYPNIIKPIYQKENIWSKNEPISKKYIYPKIKGEYVALCEGDDFWTDENKLQKQVDFLDTHPNYSICFHPVFVHWEDNRKPDTYYPSQKLITKIKNFNFKNLLIKNFIQTNSVVYRWRFHNDSTDLIPSGILPGDWFLHLLHAQVGKIGFLPEVMATYRRHSNGIWTGASKDDSWFEKCGFSNIKFFEAVEKQFNISRKKQMKKVFIQTYNAAINKNNQKLIQSLQETYPQILLDIKKEKFISIKVKLYSLVDFITAKIFHKKFEEKIKRIVIIKQCNK